MIGRRAARPGERFDEGLGTRFRGGPGRRIGAAFGAWIVLLAVGCGTTVERGYYAPVGVDFDRRLMPWTKQREGVSLRIACQGVYLNSVAGRTVRTTHIQMLITRTRKGEVLLPIQDVRVDLIADEALRDEGARDVLLRPAEVWSGRQAIADDMTVPSWSRRSFDLFFDDPDPDSSIPRVIRLRWRLQAEGEWLHGECLFLRIAPGDPRLPDVAAPSDTRFGVRDGYYLPGHGDLGKRRLRETIEVREHYLFHDPTSTWLF